MYSLKKKVTVFINLIVADMSLYAGWWEFNDALNEDVILYFFSVGSMHENGLLIFWKFD